jgi:DNA-binding winged helix-turn-helix (wHTH) protein/TolB-like protein/Flp pilus assembly protein TadD
MSLPDSARATSAAHRLKLGAFELDLIQGELRHAGGELAVLRRQALQVLLLLGRQAGQVVGKDRLMAEVWPDVVVAESSLAQAIADIRRCLGNDGHRLLRTVARRGYVLVPDADARPDPGLPDAPNGAALLSVALLPFVVEGPDPDLPWLARALQSDLATEVSRLMGSVVAGPGTVSRFQGPLADPVLAARELSVRHVVRGTLRREGGRLRLNVSLVDGGSGLQRWADIFFVDHATVMQALGDFAIQVERALQPELYRACAATTVAQVDAPSDADALAVRAFALWYGGFNRGNVVRAIDLLQRAVQLNPDAARAWAGIGFMTYTAYCQGWGPEREDAQRSVEAAVSQLERLDREAHYTYQCKAIAMGLRAEWARLLGQTRAWTQRHRHPSAFGAHGAVLLAQGEFDEAIAALQQALNLSPRDPFRADWQHRMAMCHLAAGRFEQACSWSQLADATNTVLGWPPIACAGLVRLGQADKARLAAAGHTVWRAAASVERLDRLLPGYDARWLQARDALVQDLVACGALPSTV